MEAVVSRRRVKMPALLAPRRRPESEVAMDARIPQYGPNTEGDEAHERKRKPAKGLPGPVLELRPAGCLRRWLADDLLGV